MARIWSVLTRGLNIVQFTWVTVLALVIATTTAIDGPAAVVGATVAIVLLLAVAGQSSLSQLHPRTEPASGPPEEEQRLRGAFRRQSAPDTPGRPRRPRAPGQALAAAQRS
ncbi:hypothetical protein ERC79_00630 [Rhodococcus sp. ABRD24]|uniref:DUF6412 domain-containing protein n=1 Tax=Rhodococcus sp. ABRD24 TaxID=2507582 RepID=UPI00103D8C70|nr:DUF6412 domain-containing protein [Rhodococcus sp. ABRD24]QBJ94638.1 hypothetical protein ERC79_00630 [Rhodococcus sp. ABRD24]